MNNPTKYLGNELLYLKKVLNSENWSCTAGSWTQKFEELFSKEFNCKYGIAMNSGTSTLHAALEAVGVKAGDEVITPALTVIMDTTAILHCNAIPVYADIDPFSLNIDPYDVKKKITKKTKAIIAVSLYGMPYNYDKLKEIASNIPIIGDNAQCLFAFYKDRLIGSLGKFSSFSFENSKILCCGEGGILLTNDENLAIKARKLGGHGFINLSAIDGRVRINPQIFQNSNYKRHDALGWNYRMPEFSAAVLLAQLERADILAMLRRESAAILMEEMKSDQFTFQHSFDYNYTHSYYTLAVNFNNKKINYNEFIQKFQQFGGDKIFSAWSVPYLEPVMQNRIFAKRLPEIYKNVNFEKCKVAEMMQPNIMQFKTNYRDLELVKKQAKILRKTIKYFKW